MWLRRLLIPLVVASLGLPVLLLLIVATARLLGALGDEVGALALDRIALGGGILWVADLVALVILQGIAGLGVAAEPLEPEGVHDPLDELES
ncbi:MAG: hypothetical protein JNG90_05350 [Planctomycetaceae bacterium]|nr:hypothetical protein [Planctomycetaceae bacterium]